MARPNSNIEIKRRSKSFIDLSLSFEPNPLNGDITLLKNERAISNALKNIIVFVVGEVPFNNSVGSYVTDYLFETYGPAVTMLLEEEIDRCITRNEPRVENQEITCQLDEYEDTIKVTIEYNIVGYDQIFTLEHLLTSTR